MFRKLGKRWQKPSGQPTAVVDQNGIATVPLDRPEILDQLWLNFIESKNTAPVYQILYVLDWEDRVRQHFTDWLRTTSPELWNTAPFDSYRQMFTRCAFPIDFQLQMVEGPLDLDIYVARLALAKCLTFDELPFPLSLQEQVNLAIKSTALWSLISMADQHEIVANICREESQKPGGAARALLARK